MSGSNRGRDSKATDWAFPLVGIVLALFLAWAIGLLQAREEQKRHQTPTAYAEAAKKDAEASCIGTDPRAVFECVDEKHKTAYQTAHDEQDLSAQQRAASSALITAVLSFMALVLSGVGVWYVKRTLDATLEAVEDTNLATHAMLDANAIARDTASKQLRPYVLIDEIKIVKSESLEHGILGFRVFCCLKNFGQTPALDMRMAVNGLHWHGSKLPPWWPFPDFPELWGPSDEKPNVLAPGQSVELLTTHINGDQIPEVQMGWRRVFVWGWVEYSGNSGEKYRTNFCRRIKIQKTESGPYCTAPFTQFHNGIDKQCEVEAEMREPIPDYVEQFDNFTGMGSWAPIFWLRWLDTQVPSTWERAPDGTLLDPEKRDYFGVIQPMLEG